MKTFKFSLVLRTRENTDVFHYTQWHYLWYSKQKSKYPLRMQLFIRQIIIEIAMCRGKE